MTFPPPPPGAPVNRGTVDMTSGQLAQQIGTWVLNVTNFSAWLNGETEEALMAPPFQYTADDVALLKSAVADMVTLGQLYLGQAELTPARDLSVFIRRLAGVKMFG